VGVLSVAGDSFVMDGKPFRILSGAVHYFRIVPEYWPDRLLKLRACGLNTVETYAAWNMHEPRPGDFRFAGGLDIARYVEVAGDLGLSVIIRPGPYICSEWDLGGLPAWLLADPGMRLRCSHTPYLEAVDRYLDALIPELASLQSTRGGPIIAMQVENEYGSYGNDTAYLQHLADGLRARGVDVLLFTSDGGRDYLFRGGTLPGVLKAVNFGVQAAENLAKLREHQPRGPLMCGEFWNGRFDHWGEEHYRRPVEEAAGVLDEVLAAGGSVNLYMFHGGTNFRFMSGANYDSEYQPTVTSYDCDALLTEAGDLTEKYHAFRRVLAKYRPASDLPVPEPATKKSFGRIAMRGQAWLFDNLDNLSEGVARPAPDPMEMLGQSHGFILYRTHVDGPREACPLILDEVHDRALVFVDGEYRGAIERNDASPQVNLGFGPGRFRLDLLVENMGRINFGPKLLDRKGITEGVRIGHQFLYGWTIFPLPLDDLRLLEFRPRAETFGPSFFRGHFKVDEPADTFLSLPGWTKGVCFLNGFNLGRYWDRGPQRTLYVPAPLLRLGENELIVFELHNAAEPVVEFVDQPDLG